MKRGEIWLISLDPTVGAEMQKTRPAIIVNDDALGLLPLRVIVPLTDWKDRYAAAAWMVKLEPDSRNRSLKPSAADCFQLRSVSQQRFVKQIGEVSEAALKEIADALTKVLRLEE